MQYDEKSIVHITSMQLWFRNKENHHCVCRRPYNHFVPFPELTHTVKAQRCTCWYLFHLSPSFCLKHLSQQARNCLGLHGRSKVIIFSSFVLSTMHEDIMLNCWLRDSKFGRKYWEAVVLNVNSTTDRVFSWG